MEMGFLSDASEKLTKLYPVSLLPAWENRKAWEAVESAADIISQAETLSQSDWPVLPAWRYMDFQRDGNRSRYEAVYFERRNRLLSFLAAECCEGKGRFMEGIINGLWAVLEESSWVIPAHNNHYPNTYCGHDALPDVEKFRYMDLFSAGTGALVAAIYGIMGKQLEKESPLIPRRCEIELEKRIMAPFLERDDLHWMGLQGQPVNNWNPWINQNILFTFLMVEKDETRKLEAVKKNLKSCQQFLNMYAPDGGCDEGPSYFNAAGACYLDLCEMISKVTRGEMDFFQEELTRNIAGYQYMTHIAGAYYTNYADAPHVLSCDGRLFIRLADRLGMPELKNFGQMQIAANPDVNNRITPNLVFRTIQGLLTPHGEALDYRAAKGGYYPGIQVCVAREKENSDEGFFFSAKGGHNAEGHNHNDVGNFLLYKDGKPVVVDVGVGAYTAKTFSAQRYEIWSMQSNYHNVPLCSGQGQLPGGKYAARDVFYEDNGTRTRFALDLSAAYGEGADVKRAFCFDREKGVLTICDSGRGLKEHFMLKNEPKMANGCIDLGGVYLRYDAARLKADCEMVRIDDEKMAGEWKQDHFWRLSLTPYQNYESWVMTFDHAE